MPLHLVWRSADARGEIIGELELLSCDQQPVDKLRLIKPITVPPPTLPEAKVQVEPVNIGDDSESLILFDLRRSVDNTLTSLSGDSIPGPTPPPMGALLVCGAGLRYDKPRNVGAEC